MAGRQGPIDEPSDLEGLKVRVVSSPLFQDTFEALMFMVAMAAALALVATFPALALWLPGILGYNV